MDKPNKHKDELKEPAATYGPEALNFDKVWMMFRDVAERQKETDRLFKETDKKINQISGMFSTQWGKLMEALIAPSCLKLFKERGVDVTQTMENIRIRRDGLEAEYDIVLANGNKVVIVEVKTTMTIAKVKEFVEKMKDVKTMMPIYSDKKIYGAVAGIKYEEDSHKYAYRKGLFVLTNKGEGLVDIANKPEFVPLGF